MAQKVLDALTAKFGDAIKTASTFGDEIVWVPREKLVDVATFLKTEKTLAFDSPVFVTVTDYLTWQDQTGSTHGPVLPMATTGDELSFRYEVSYQLRSVTHRHRVRIKVLLSATDAKLPSLAGLWSAFNWQEREAFDMYGVVFEGHPDLRRIYLYDEFVGHPLRKDYPKDKRQPLVRRGDLPDQLVPKVTL